MKFTETRSMSMSKLRALCVAHDWYTCGTNEEYDHLLNLVHDEMGYPVNLTTDKLVEIATDIMEHSDIKDYTIESVLFELARNCYHYFDVVA